jgi:hypothetical protein
MGAVKTYYFSIQETKRVRAESLEEAEDILYGAKEGYVDEGDWDTMFVAAFDEDGNEVSP